MFVTICYYFIVTIIIIITIIITLLLSLLPIIFTPSAPLASAPPYDSNSTSASTTPISRQPLHPYSSFLFFSFSPLPTPLLSCTPLESGPSLHHHPWHPAPMGATHHGHGTHGPFRSVRSVPPPCLTRVPVQPPGPPDQTLFSRWHTATRYPVSPSDLALSRRCAHHQCARLLDYETHRVHSNHLPNLPSPHPLDRSEASRRLYRRPHDRVHEP